MARWSPAALDKLRRLYPVTPLPQLAFQLKRNQCAVKSKASALGLVKASHKPWTRRDDAQLRRRYKTESAAVIATGLGRTLCSVQNRVHTLGLQKPAGWIAECASQRWRDGRHENSRKHCFPKGHVPANKGLRRPGWSPGRMAQTQFKRGRAATEARNYVPIGTEKVDSKRGVLVRKLTDDPALFPVSRWRPVHVIVWEAANGKVPAGHIIRFRDGMKTLVAAQIAIDKLECVTLAENMRRNSYHNRYPKEIGLAIQARAVLQRRINKMARQA